MSRNSISYSIRAYGGLINYVHHQSLFSFTAEKSIRNHEQMSWRKFPTILHEPCNAECEKTLAAVEC